MKKLLSLPILLVMALVAAACTSSYAETSSPNDIVCIIGAGGKYGNELKRVVPPNSPGSAYKYDSMTERSVFVPGTERFWNESFDEGNRDIGASDHVPMLVQGIRLQVPVQVDFTPAPDVACELYLNHLSRYEPLNYGNEDPNVRSGWLNWLNQNFGRTLDKTAEGSFTNTNGYTPQGLINNFDMNANELGVLEEGDVYANVGMKAHLEDAWSELFHTELERAIGGSYFCGVGYDPGNPEVCPPLEVSIVGEIRVHPEEEAFITSFCEQSAAASNAVSQQNITTSVAIVEAERVEQERIRIEADNDIAELERQAAQDNQQTRSADLQRQVEEARLQAEIDNADCIYIFETTGETCATQAAAENGTFYPGEAPPAPVLVPSVGND